MKNNDLSKQDFFNDSLSKRIKELINSEFDSLRIASEKLSLEYTRFSAMLNSSRPISKDLLFALAKEGYSLDYILHGVGSPYLESIDFQINYFVPYSLENMIFALNSYSALALTDRIELRSFADEIFSFIGFSNSKKYQSLGIYQDSLMLFKQDKDFLMNINPGGTFDSSIIEKINNTYFAYLSNEKVYLANINLSGAKDNLQMKFDCKTDLNFDLSFSEGINKINPFNIIAILSKVINLDVIEF